MAEPIKTTLYFSQTPPEEIGGMSLAGAIRGSIGTQRWRVLGSYALVYLLAGGGFYEDAVGGVRKVSAGDMIVVYPELAHHYGPTRIKPHWDEINIVFKGAIFDAWRQCGLLDSQNPILHVGLDPQWRTRFEEVVRAPRPSDGKDWAQELCRLQSLFLDLLSASGWSPPAVAPHEPAWLAAAKLALDKNLSERIDLEEVACSMGITYEVFRRSFRQHVGLPPHRWRIARRIEAAARLLEQTTLSHSQIAESIGYADEFIFSRQFREVRGMSPREYRKTRR